MKKLGFTMPELIITLAIVGIAAAVAAPVIGNLMPDKNKLKAIECYNLVNAATEEFLSDEGIYFAPDLQTWYEFDTSGQITAEYKTRSRIPNDVKDRPDGYPDCEALMCFDNPPDRVPYVDQNLTSRDKYKGLLFKKYGLVPKELNANGTPKYDKGGISSDGTEWKIGTTTIYDKDKVRVSRKGKTYYGYKIEFDVNPNNNNDANASCSYDPDTCKNPDKFIIYVNHEGNIFAGDPMIEAYLLNPLNMNTKKEDRAKALELSNSKNYDEVKYTLYTPPTWEIK